ncbi:MAG: hypothetical protein J0L75_11125 [Spirochaetes bacterium]|nr:hypothetical protein [Spirochaetota bacterium]
MAKKTNRARAPETAEPQTDGCCGPDGCCCGEKAPKPAKQVHHHSSALGGFWFLGAVGTGFWMVSHATGFWPVSMAVLKAIFWPVVVMYKVAALLGL